MLFRHHYNQTKITSQEEIINRLLVDTALEQSLPKLYEQDKSEVKILYARFYHPIYNWEWFAMEYSKLQGLFFGLVDGEVLEYGYFTVDELERVGAKRDYTFAPKEIKGENYGKRAI